MSTTSKLSSNHNPYIFKRYLLVVLIFILLLFANLLAPLTVQALPPFQSTSTPTAQPTPTFDVQRLEQPVIASDHTEQLKEGSEIYWGICMACHGDVGQGLTDEWRDAFGVEDRNCWQSGCHGADHPPQGFLIPKDKVIPGVAGSGKLARFKNAQELHDFILANMPWWDPGQLTDEESWQVTAYILKLHKVMPSRFDLTDTNASAIRTQYAVPQPSDDRPAVLTLTGILALAAISMIAQDLRKNKIRFAERANFFHHLHPPTIPTLQARLRYTLGAGGLAVFLCLVLLVTGILEMFYYIPTPEHAAVSVEAITSLVPFGALIRNVHFWGAQALMIVMSVHLLRVVLTGAYARHRRLNYLIGLGMLVLVLLLDFTGYVLRWDEGIRWALIVGTNLLKTIPWIGNSLYHLAVGGPEPGLSSIERFYTWHIFVLTLGMIFLGAWHIFRVRRDGGVAVPPPDQRPDQTRISRFDLARREVLVMLVAAVVLLFVSTLFPAPIERPITQTAVDMGTSAHNARAPWFFLWVQQLLKLGDPFFWGVAIPVFLLILLALVPYMLPQTKEGEFGRWFPRGNRIAQIIIVLITLALILLTILAILPTVQL
jgi:quinol-cytochrome oxidoreductase complex cytochrome b subunit/mono/diheme cytochrome c family protein